MPNFGFLVFFVCRLKPHCEVSNALKKWHIAYHGTSVGTLRRTLDHNQLLPGTKMALTSNNGCLCLSAKLISIT